MYVLMTKTISFIYLYKAYHLLLCHQNMHLYAYLFNEKSTYSYLFPRIFCKRWSSLKGCKLKILKSCIVFVKCMWYIAIEFSLEYKISFERTTYVRYLRCKTFEWTKYSLFGIKLWRMEEILQDFLKLY